MTTDPTPHTANRVEDERADGMSTGTARPHELIEPDRIVVMGGGTMGCHIAALVAQAGLDVALRDSDPDTTDARVGDARTVLANLGELASAGTIERLDDLAEFAASANPLLLEALPEDLDLKVGVLAPILATAPQTVILTNTSSIPIDHLQAHLGMSPNLAGLHFFNPAMIIPGVEVIPGALTETAVIQLAVEFARRLGKVPTVVPSSTGFIANRLQLALFAEAARCVEEGLATPSDIDTVTRTTFGLRLAAFGPFAIADMAGLDVFTAILENLSAVFGSRFEAPSHLRDLVRAGKLGTKTGSGYFEHDQGAPSRKDTDIIYRRLAEFAISNNAANNPGP